MTERQSVGFVGLGHMGWPMAHNLAEAGFTLVVYDNDSEVAQRFATEHVCVAASGPESFKDVELVVTMLPNGGVVQEAMLRWEGGIAAMLRSGAVIVDMSSANPNETLELAKAVEADGVRVVDAPVSGGVPRASTGELSIMVGGEDDAVEAAQPVLRVMGDPARQFRTGVLSTGHAMKALNNYVAAATYAATAEALALGREFGLDPGKVIDVINTSTGRSFVSEFVYGGEVVSGRYATGFLLGLLAKDVAIANELATSTGVEAPVCQLTHDRWSQALAALGGGADHSEAHKAWWPESFERNS
jgi:3-hydroxyisobutyrate dehydrogenase